MIETVNEMIEYHKKTYKEQSDDAIKISWIEQNR
jgi:hypothetical protein